jgi:hypothetical protein
MDQEPIPRTETEFTIEIKACAPITANGDKGELTIYLGGETAYTAVVPPLDGCGCGCPSEQANPLYIYDLKRSCPDPRDQEDVYAWDCETNYEATSGPALTQHNLTVPGRYQFDNQSPPWLRNCKKCKCPINAPLTIDWSYDDGAPCGDGHQCDAAVFNFGFLRGTLDQNSPGGLAAGNGSTIPLGTFNLNNGSSGGPVRSPTVTVSKEQIAGAIFQNSYGDTQITLYVRCALQSCHQGISHCVMKDASGNVLIDKCFDAGETVVTICKAPQSNTYL